MSRSVFRWVRRIMSPCFFIGHDDLLKVLKRGKLHFECPLARAE